MPFIFDNSYLKLSNAFYASAKGQRTPKCEYAILNRDLASSLGISLEALESEIALNILSGNTLLENAANIAMAYAGHQFGYFTMLGDGRAMLLGEVITANGTRKDLHLKGSGPTAYSRRGDGKAALGPMLREYLISEAIHALNIPTSRSLAVISTGEYIQREQPQKGAVLCRVAQSHLRVGTFQYAAALSAEQPEYAHLLKELADYAIWRHPAFHPQTPDSKGDISKVVSDQSNPYLNFYTQIVNRQALLVAKWQSVGFIHGVLNTDNTAISGETIDYGPCAFMDVYHPQTVFSSIDHQGRYAYNNQPNMVGWNLARLAEALMPLFDSNQDQARKLAELAINSYIKNYESHYHQIFCEKLGISSGPEHHETSKSIIETFLNLLQVNKLDFTESFVWLTLVANNDPRRDSINARYQTLHPWLETWYALRETQNINIDVANNEMMLVNPCMIPKNHLVEHALNAWTVNNDKAPFLELHDHLSAPYAYTDQRLDALFAANNKSGGRTPQYKTYCGT